MEQLHIDKDILPYDSDDWCEALPGSIFQGGVLKVTQSPLIGINLYHHYPPLNGLRDIMLRASLPAYGMSYTCLHDHHL